jgi:hypothetical protein
VAQGVAGQGKAREVVKWKGTAAACMCGMRGCVWWQGYALVVCVGGRLARSFVECGGGVAWVRLCVDMAVVAVRMRAHFSSELKA